MGMIEGFRIQKFGVLKDIKLGKLWNEKGNKLTPLVAVIGRNGVGKAPCLMLLVFCQIV
jgi:AAA15 family ATPase/GTPase